MPFFLPGLGNLRPANDGFLFPKDLLKRAREVLSAQGKVPSDEEAIVKALQVLLEKRDPLRKAARAESRKQRKETALRRRRQLMKKLSETQASL